MPETELTTDLDADELPFIERMQGLLTRLLQSGFLETDRAREDVERMIDLLRATRER